MMQYTGETTEDFRKRVINACSVEAPTPEQIAARERWVALLRTDEYEQTKYVLCTEDGKGRCCMGVAVDPKVTGIELEWEPEHITRYLGEGQPGVEIDARAFSPLLDDGDFEPEAGVMPPSIQRALGFTDDNPEVVREDHVGLSEAVATLNDSADLTFVEIADLIESHYITPFKTA